MKTPYLFLLSFTGMIAFSCCLISCQPEVDPLPPQRVDSTTASGGLLTKIYCRDGNDSMSLTFEYDVQNRWSGSRLYVVLNNDTSPVIHYYIQRDAAGAISKSILVDSNDYQYAVYSDTQYVYKDAISGRYKYAILNNNYTIDTIFYVYNAQGQITAKNTKTTDSYPGSNSSYYDTTSLSFNGNNVARVLKSPLSTTENSTTYQYDTKASPCQFGNESIIVSDEYFLGANNITMFTTKYQNIIEGQAVVSYTYNADGKPVKALLTSLPSNKQYTFTYVYR